MKIGIGKTYDLVVNSNNGNAKFGEDPWMDVQCRERRVDHFEFVYRAECSVDETELGIENRRRDSCFVSRFKKYLLDSPTYCPLCLFNVH